MTRQRRLLVASLLTAWVGLVLACGGGRVSGEHAEPVGVRFERDRAAALPVPEPRVDACVLQSAQVDKYQTVRFDHNSYSVPRRWAFRPVTVKGYVAHVEGVADGQVIARHARCYGKGERVLDPLHYLVTLERKPAALDHAPVYRDWQLPAAVVELRQAFARHAHRCPALHPRAATARPAAGGPRRTSDPRVSWPRRPRRRRDRRPGGTAGPRRRRVL